jgi:tRNA dimethylallyltransferase
MSWSDASGAAELEGGGRGAGPPTTEPLRIICGPTAAGKSAVAMELAEAYGAMIIAADSRQVYRGFDVGTAKPSADDRRRVPHRGIDVVEPEDRYSAARWASDAAGWIAEARDLGRVPLIVGGTGLYLRALLEPFFVEPTLDLRRRDALRSELGVMPTVELRRWCERLDVRRAHLGRSQLARAIEVALLTGERLSALQERGAGAPVRAARYLVVDPGPSLGVRIEVRAAAALGGDWQDEVRRLAREVPLGAPAWNATGYGRVRDLVEGRIDHETARQSIVIETRQYAKRQRTWFRHQLPADVVTRVSPDDPGFAAIVGRWWAREGGV